MVNLPITDPDLVPVAHVNLILDAVRSTVPQEMWGDIVEKLEQVESEPLRARLVEDLAECQARVRDGLDYARSADAGGPLQAVDLDAVVASVCDDAVAV